MADRKTLQRRGPRRRGFLVTDAGGNPTVLPFTSAGDVVLGDGTIGSPPGGGGSGDVVGPAGAVNNRIAVYDGTTGKLIKDSGETIADVLSDAATTATGLAAAALTAAEAYTDSELSTHTADADAHKGQKHSIEIDSADLQLVGDTAAPGAHQVYGTDGSGNRGWKADPSGGGGATLGAGFAGDGEVGVVRYVRVPHEMTITVGHLVADDVGDAVVDIAVGAFAGIPGSMTSIVASAPLTLSSAQTVEDSTLTGWNVTVSAGEWLAFRLVSCAGLSHVHAQLSGIRG